MELSLQDVLELNNVAWSHSILFCSAKTCNELAEPKKGRWEIWCLAQQLSWLTTDLGPKPPRENAAKSRCPKGTSVFRGEDSNLYQQNSEAREWFCIMVFQHIKLRYWLTNQRGKDRQRYPTNEIHDSTLNKNTSTFGDQKDIIHKFPATVVTWILAEVLREEDEPLYDLLWYRTKGHHVKHHVDATMCLKE